MKIRELAIGALACLSLALTVQAQTSEITLDWKFSTGENPSIPTIVTGTTNMATGTFLPGGIYTYFFGTGDPSGIYGTPTGLWAMEKGTTAPTLELKLDQTPVQTVDVTLVLTHFIDNSQFPGTASFNLPNAQLLGRVVVQEQTGNMIGFWAEDTYLWSAVTFLDPTGHFGVPITLDLFPGLNSSGLLLDEVKLSILGAVSTVPEPMCGQLAALGLLLFGIRSWLRNRKA